MPRQKRSSLVSKQKANKRSCSEHYSHETNVFRKDKTSISSALPKRNMRCQTLEDSCLNDLNCCENSEAAHYVIMDVQFLKGLLKNLLCDVCKSYSLKIDIGEKLGFSRKISIFCTSCDIIKSINFTSRRISDSEGNENQSFDINMRMVQSFLSFGKGYLAMEKFLKSLNYVRSQVKSAYQSNSTITDIDVTFDGTWLTRGHSSQIGVGCVIDLLTGFVMDFLKLCRNAALNVNTQNLRLGTSLRKAVKEWWARGVSLGGKSRGSLKEETIKKLSRYYQNAIRSNKGDVEAMKTAIYATLFHSISTDQKPQHFKCPTGKDSWCFFQAALTRGEVPGPHVKHVKTPLKETHLAKIMPIYQILASNELLQRCIRCVTQNANENLHSIIWGKCSKETSATLRRVTIAVCDAVCEFNFGTKNH
ncbi:uncharacterized protein TNCV_3990261 [Trichonephila clavipes]|uniref:Mutator-like transposase domain-containing protein n=1 Tax=Trichonephila clavipes TaxID=2585209 RepID=A0A8X6T435_TRICX|nr:uncharacterized protein TNCV_3990261 [Trichonephila clavipes]